MSPESDRFYLDLLRAYLDSADDAIFVLCDEQKFLLCNRRMEQWLGETEASLTCHSRRLPIARFFKEPASAERFMLNFNTTLQAAQPTRFECTLEPPQGESRRVEFALNMVDVEAAQMVIVVARDVTHQQQNQAMCRKLSSAVEQTADSVVITNREGAIEYVNPAFVATTGFSPEEAVGKTPRLVKSGRHSAAFYEQLWSTILNGEVYRAVLMNRRQNGEIYYEEKTITPLRDANGEITHFVSTGKDVTARVRVEERLDYLAYYDPLTALPNRNLFQDRLTHALDQARPHHRQTAVVFLDLDNFRSVNDSLGHEAGDAVLQGVAARLQACAGPEISVARMGNDEFAILFEDIGDAERAAQQAQRLIEAFAEPFRLDDHDADVFVSMHLGIAMAPFDGDEADRLWKNADTALHHAKSLGRNRFHFYSADMTDRVREHLALRTELVRALERNEFRLHYQPIVALQNNAIVGVEALLRWQHPERGLIGPDAFIPVLEESGLILRVGEWVLGEVCRQAQLWHRMGSSPLRVAVNVSVQQFVAPDFIRSVGCLGCVIGGQGQCSGITEFEITESVFMHVDPVILETLRTLRNKGIRLSIDDFGTGYSSLSYLTRFEVDTVKIDRSFVRDMLTNRQAAALVEAIIAMAHALNLTVVAEGVETVPECNYLRGLGCDMIQGHVFSPAVPPEVLTELLESRKE